VSPSRVARSYAEALFSVAQKWGQEDEMGAKLVSLKNRLEEDAELQRIFQQQLLTPEDKEKALKALIPRLSSRTTEETIVDIVNEYQVLLDKAKNREYLEITVAAPLSPTMVSELESRLSSFTGKNIRLQIKVDPKVLGGLVLRWGDQVIDASVKHKLESICAQIKSDRQV